VQEKHQYFKALWGLLVAMQKLMLMAVRLAVAVVELRQTAQRQLLQVVALVVLVVQEQTSARSSVEVRFIKAVEAVAVQWRQRVLQVVQV
jgi:hypothetical protein